MANRNDEIIGPAYGLKGIDDIPGEKATGSGTGTEKRTLPSISKAVLKSRCCRMDALQLHGAKNHNQKYCPLAAVEDVVPLEDSQLAMLSIDPAKTPPLIDCTSCFQILIRPILKQHP